MMKMDQVGVWAFYAGLVIAVIASVWAGALSTTTVLILGALGIVVGLLNVVDKEVNSFLVAGIAFVVGASSLSAILSEIPAVGTIVPTFLNGVVVFVAPGAAIVALRAIWDITKSK